MMGGLLEIPIASALFLLLFGVSLLRYIRQPDPMAGMVVLIFGVLSPVFAARLLNVFFDFELPPAVQAVALLGVLAQPPLTLWLASMLQRVPRWLLAAAAAGFALSAPVVFMLDPTPPLPLVLGAVAIYSATSLVAAVYFARAAGRRIGTARLRLVVASASALLMAATLMVLAVSPALPAASEITGVAARYGVLLAALGFAFAFITPGWLRQLLNARTSYDLSRRLLTSSAQSDEAATWQTYLELVGAAAGVEHGAVIIGRTGQGGRAIAGLGAGQKAEWSAAALDRLADHARRGGQRALAGMGAEEAAHLPAQTRYLTVVALPAARGGLALVVLADEQRSLFSQDDIEIFETLGLEAALLADRAAASAEQIRLTERLAATVEELRKAHEAKSDFLASMSHELRTPLNAILGFSDLMRSEPAAQGRRQVPEEWIEHVHVAGRHLLELINDVLDLAKVEAGRLDLHPERIDLRTAVTEAIAGLRPLADDKQLVLSGQAEPIELTADRGRLRQVLYNLLSNAIKYTPERGSVTVLATALDGFARIAVRDTGVGIAAEDQPRVFEEFTQVGELASRQEGTGLGLALTRRLVEAHGGRLLLDSELGKGSTFTVELPLAGPARTEVVRPQVNAGPVAGWPGDRPVVLVIEDDPQAVVLLRSYVEPQGYQLAVASDGETGLAEALSRRPAAILLDVLLPGVDGWEVLRRLKADTRLRDIPVLMITVVDEREVGLALGAADYLVKPIERGALLAALARHIARAGNGRRPRVLAVDDDRAALAVVEAALRDRDCDVVLAESGTEALELARAGPIDLLICDLVMPDVDGFELIARLRADPQTSELPILVLTGHQLGPADKRRLNGQIVGICAKAEDVPEQLQRWLEQVTVEQPSP